MSLSKTWGYVEELAIEQEGKRDTLRVWLRGHPQYYFTYLDAGATVALAQLQLLRDALERNLQVRLSFKPGGVEGVYADIFDNLHAQYQHPSRFFQVKLYAPASFEASFFGRLRRGTVNQDLVI